MNRKLATVALAIALGLSCLGTVAAADDGTVLLIHGIWGGPESWEDYAVHLQKQGWREGCLIEFPAGSTTPVMVPRDRYAGGNLTSAATWVPDSICNTVPADVPVFFRVVFRDNDSQTFRMQGKQVAAAVQRAKRLTGDAKVTLVSHSMGGLASRAYLQAPEYLGDVETLVTVATPHLGSLLPFLEEQDLDVCRFLAKWVAGKDLGAPGVSLLAPDSAEMVNLSTGGAPYTELPTNVIYANVVGNFESSGWSSCVIRHQEWLASWQMKLKDYFNAAAAHAVVSPEVFANWSDGIVPVASQYLKVAPVGYPLDIEVETVEGFHSDFPGMPTVWNLVERWLPRGGGGLPAGCDVIDLALLIDSSGSMGDNDPRGLRKEAASLVLDRAPGGTVFSVVDFDNSAKALVSRSTNVDEVRRTLGGIDASGGTNIESALDSGYSSLKSGTGARAAILFTDGRSDQRGGTEGYLQDNIPIHVVGLGSGVDTDYLQRLAASTNGLYMHASTAGDLTEIFDRVISELACEGTVYSNEGTIQPGEVIEHTFLVDATISRLTTRVTWPGSRIDVELIGPSGTSSGQEVASGPTYRIVAADRPAQGKWTARVIGTQVASSGEPYSIRAGGPSDLRLAVSQPDRLDPSILNVSTVDNTGGARVSDTWSRVRYPNGQTTQGPNLANSGSGTWSLPVPVDSAGIYTVTAGLNGSLSQGGDWSREITRTVVIGQGMVPWRGRVTRAEGGYITINRGRRHGVREGMRVTFRPGSSPAGSGLVTSVSSSSSTVEVQEMWGSGMVTNGMSIELDRRQWMADRR